MIRSRAFAVAVGLLTAALDACSQPQEVTPAVGNMQTAVTTQRAAMMEHHDVARRQMPRLLESVIRHHEHPAWMRIGGDRTPENGYVFVAQFYGSSINQYRADNQENDPPICRIETGEVNAQGMTTDIFGNLYTTQYVNFSNVAIAYGSNCGKPERTYFDPDGVADDIVLDGNTVYVSNLDNGATVPATIDVFERGDSERKYELSNPFVTTGVGVAVDSHHNLFWSAASKEFNGGFVVEFYHDGEKRTGAVLGATKIGNDFPGGIIIDRADNLLLIDQNKKLIYIYASPYHDRPFKTIRLEGTTVDCAFGVNERRLYCLDYEFGSVDIYAYPAGTYIHSFTNGIDAMDEPTGIAVQIP